MRRIVTVAILTATIAVGFLVHAPQGWACSCLSQTVEQHYASAAFVFAGRIEELSAAPETVTVEVALEEIFKGKLPATLLLGTNASTAACGFTFVRGSRYTIFANQDGDDLITSACAGTTDDPAVRPVVRELAAPEPAASIETAVPLAIEEPRAAAQASRAGPIAAAALLIAAMAFFVGWVRMTR